MISLEVYHTLRISSRTLTPIERTPRMPDKVKDFKVGVRVRRLSKYRSENEWEYDDLVCTVTKVEPYTHVGGFVRLFLNNDQSSSWDSNRFEIVKPKKEKETEMTKTKFPTVIKPKPVVSPLELVPGQVTLGSKGELTAAYMHVHPMKASGTKIPVVKLAFQYEKPQWSDYHHWLSAEALRELSDFCLEAADILETMK